jgi:ligand-binding sensor domain-containing protein
MRIFVVASLAAVLACSGTAAGAMTEGEIDLQVQRAMERGGADAVQESSGVRTSVAERFQPEVEHHPDFTAYRFTGELGLQQIYGVSAAANGVWLATSAGLARYEPGADLWTLVRPPPESGAQGVVAVAATGRQVGVGFWAYPKPGHAQPKGAYWYRPWTSGWQRMVESDDIEPAHWDGDALWMIAANELLQVRPDDGYLKRVTVETNPFLAGSRVRRLTTWEQEIWIAGRGEQDRRDQVWRGGGVTWRAGPFHPWRHFTVDDGLVHNYCAAVAVDGREAWVAHWEEERGLSRYDRARHAWQGVITSAEGIPLGGVELALDGDTLWIGQQGGLVKLDRRSLRAKRYTEQDGLPGYIVSGISVGERDVWVSVYAYGGEGHNGVRSAGVVRLPRAPGFGDGS